MTDVIDGYEILSMREATSKDIVKNKYHDMIGKIKLDNGEEIELSFWSGGMDVGEELEDALDHYAEEFLSKNYAEMKKAELRKKNSGHKEIPKARKKRSLWNRSKKED